METYRQRIKKIEQTFQVRSLPPVIVAGMIMRAVENKRPISVIRLGDVMAKLLAQRNLNTLKHAAPFLGIPYPPPPQLLTSLAYAARHATIVGMSHFDASREKLKQFMHKTHWKPRNITDAFINDQLYEQLYLHMFMRKYRVALVGRSARAAAGQLIKRGYPRPLTVNLDSYHQITRAFHQLQRHRHNVDLVLVGASVPGRILCVKIAKQLNITAVEIGHIMDALANPMDWSRPHNRRRAVERWMKIIRNRQYKRLKPKK